MSVRVVAPKSRFRTSVLVDSGAQVKTAPVAAETADQGLAPIRYQRTEVGPMITARPPDTRPRLFEVSPKSLPEPGTHWFVSDPAGYCLACGLPRANRHHVERAA